MKTSSGLADSGATAADVALMRGVVGLKIGVKAAGGIRTAAQFMEMVDAGANRIGTSASVQIVQELGAPAGELIRMEPVRAVPRVVRTVCKGHPEHDLFARAKARSCMQD